MATGNLIRLSFGGGVNNDQDLWSNTIHLAAEDGTKDARAWMDEVSLSAIFDLIQHVYVSGQNDGMASMFDLRWVKLAEINSTGHYVGAPRVFNHAPVKNANNPYSHSFSDTLAVTFDSETYVNNKKVKGRVYPPAFNVEIAPNGLVNAQDLIKIASAFAGLLHDIATIPAEGTSIVTVIQTKRAGVFGFAPIDSVRVGNIFDVQRRRRNSIKETYVSQPVVK